VRSAWIIESSDLGIGAGGIDQVDGVDYDRRERAVGHHPPKGGHVLLTMLGGAPHPRVLVEDLNRVAAALDAALVGSHEAARRGDVGAD
jgi:hypothetical protein